MDNDLSNRMSRLVDDIVTQHPDITIDELNRLLHERTDDYNHAPQPEMAGLSPAQMHRLLYGSWDGPGAALQLNRNLLLNDLLGSRMLANARLLLTSVLDHGSVKATAKGNLNRYFVIEMAKAMQLSPDWAMILERHPPFKEEDVNELYVLRHILLVAGLLRKFKGNFNLTKKGAVLSADENAGELFAVLFETVFRKLNLAFITRHLPDFPPLQHTISFSFYAISTLGVDWLIEKESYERLVLPAIREAVTPGKFSDPLRWMVSGWILHPLDELGLVEIERSVWTDGHEERPERVRKTPLFDRFLDFRLDPAELPGHAGPVRVHVQRGNEG